MPPVWNKGLRGIGGGTPKGTRFSLKHRKKLSQAKWKKENLLFRGENHPNWQGGKSFEKYTIWFNDTLKQFVREKYGNICQFCGNYEKERRLSIHHINYNKLDCSIENLIPLCVSCHGKTNVEREHWNNIFELKKYQEIDLIIR